MSILTLGYNFEERLNYTHIKKYIASIKRRFTAEDVDFKTLLQKIEKEFQTDTQVITDIKNLGRDELQTLNQQIKKFNLAFDKLNNLYYDENYNKDGELKQLFSSISRQAHRIENVSHKYLYQKQNATQTPNYIRDGLA